MQFLLIFVFLLAVGLNPDARAETLLLAQAQDSAAASADGAAGAGQGSHVDEEQLEDLLVEVEELRQQGRAAEALAPAMQVATEVEEHYGEGMQLARSLVPVIELQLEANDRPAAEQSLNRMISMIERHDSVFSQNLVDPLTVLAEIYSADNRRDEAITALRRARHITHRKKGILNLDQIEIADQLAATYYEMGNIKDANRENRFTFRVSVNEFGEDSSDLVPAINKLAGWYERIGEFSLARHYYKKSIAIIENEYGADDLRLVNQLQGVAATYRGQNQLRGEGRDALMRAVEIFDSHPEADSIARAMSLAELGDWLMVTSRRQEAIGKYQEAWNILTGDGANPENGADIFGRPKRLRFNPPIPNPLSLTGVQEIFVDVAFIVSPEGSVTDVEVQDSTAHWRLQNDVRLAMRNARYRPRLKDGEPVSAKMKFRWTYRLPEHLRRPRVTPATEQSSPQSSGSATKNSRN